MATQTGSTYISESDVVAIKLVIVDNMLEANVQTIKYKVLWF